MGRPLTPTLIGLALAPLAMAPSVVAPPVAAQGVPVFDAAAFARGEEVIAARERDLALQRDRLARDQELAEIARQQLAALDGILDGVTSGDASIAATVAALETGDGAATAASVLYAPEDSTPAASRLFGDARETVEELIIRAARDTHALAGVARAGLSLVQWRCLLQALIWQESRFQIGARSPAGAYGLTQIMPGTAEGLGIYPEYYDDPYLQVTGGARYLAQLLAMFDGNIVHALAGYNAGPGRVQEYGGVPPFAETQQYVEVIPEQYNRYLAMAGGPDALGTIDPVLLTQAGLSLSAHGSGVYGDASLAAIRAAAQRIRDIIMLIGQTDDLQEAIALNTYARAELARVVALRTRMIAARTLPLSDAGIALAAAQAAERQFMTFRVEELQ